jgi:hypothetical protein
LFNGIEIRRIYIILYIFPSAWFAIIVDLSEKTTGFFRRCENKISFGNITRRPLCSGVNLVLFIGLSHLYLFSFRIQWTEALEIPFLWVSFLRDMAIVISVSSIMVFLISSVIEHGLPGLL